MYLQCREKMNSTAYKSHPGHAARVGPMLMLDTDYLPPSSCSGALLARREGVTQGHEALRRFLPR